jgi:hydrogenase-4 transcriptional activator
MEKFKQILLDVYREACRHIKISESTPNIARMLHQHLPISQVLIRTFNSTHLSIDTAAIGFCNTSSEFNYFISKEVNQTDKKKLISNHKKKQILQWSQHKTSEALFDLLLPMKVDEGFDILVGPLAKENDVFPFLLIISKQGTIFELRHIDMMQILIEPFSIALENDSRLREMIRLREAAEADKKTLLTKLSRNKIGDIIVGAESGLKNVMERVMLVAKSDVPVLIFGETGTGKEVIARAIHNNSGRRNGPFIRVNCGAIPSELIDSQLFGHERGAFTGAVESRKGWFERADGGTLFLDEVAELPLPAQVRFLRILQDGWLERVGGKHPIKVDVRIVLATHRDLASMVAQGKFREDLWYRIATFPIFLPPLRERIEDLKDLAEHFAKRSAIRFGLPLLLPSQEDIKILASYSWPGNIRELGTVLDRAALLGTGRKLEITKALGWSENIERVPNQKKAEVVQNNLPHQICSLDSAIKNHIILALSKTKGRVEGEHGAAKLLNINPHTLRARMRKLGINWAEFRAT